MTAPRLFGVLLFLAGGWLFFVGLTHRTTLWWGALWA